jgi:flagellar biosynthesis/type III secretory pathway protein FliH
MTGEPDRDQRAENEHRAERTEIVPCELAGTPDVLDPHLERVLDVVRERSEALVHVNPEDLEALEVRTLEGCRFIADTSVERGDLVIETPLGRIVRSVREQLEAVRNAVRDVEVTS